jgi:hypothetical protein
MKWTGGSRYHLLIYFKYLKELNKFMHDCQVPLQKRGKLHLFKLIMSKYCETLLSEEILPTRVEARYDTLLFEMCGNHKLFPSSH